MGDEPLSDLEIREQSLSGVRNALAALQQVPAAGLDAAKHETFQGMSDDATALERALSNEADQLRDCDSE